MSEITWINYDTPEAYKEAKSEFVVFTTSQSNPEEIQLLQVYKNQPQFRKLSMVCPVIKVGNEDIYGYTHGELGWKPKLEPSSREPYAIQAGSVLNSVIRKSALDKIDFTFYGNSLIDSVNLSTELWKAGLRIYIDPRISVEGPTYMSFGVGTVLEKNLEQLFKREMIG